MQLIELEIDIRLGSEFWFMASDSDYGRDLGPISVGRERVGLRVLS